MINKDENGRIFLTSTHHSDLTWQFSYEEYDKIREEQLNIVMGFFSKYPEYGFIIDQAYVLENYLERNPKQRDNIIQYFNKGNGSLELFGAYAIPDLNMCSGESFIRNCILGQQYYLRQFGCLPITASLDDAFGMPFQVPQVLAKLGYQYLIPGRTPNAQSGLNADQSFVWQGMGQTKIIVVQQDAGVDKSSYISNVPVIQNESERFIKTLTDLQNTSDNVLAYYKTEFQMLDEMFFKHLEAVNQNPNAKRKVTFGRFTDYCKTIKEEDLPIYHGEFNPTLTGCYTTRIGVKQKIRAAENAVFDTELASALTGKEIDLSKVWLQLNLGQFDASCGCHHDICNIDVHEKLDFVLEQAVLERDRVLEKSKGQTLLVMNPSAYSESRLVETTIDAIPADIPIQKEGDHYYFVADLPAHGAKYFTARSNTADLCIKKVDPSAYCGKSDYYTFDFTGPAPKITSNRFGHSVFGQERFAEILFHHESGSMWDECLLEPPCGMEYQEETVTDVEEGPLFINVTTTGSVKPGKKPISGNAGMYWPGFESLSFKKEYIFPLHLPYFQLRLTLDFAGCNTKISLRIPVELDPLNAVALYDTPFAALQRKPYFEVPYQYEATLQPLSSHRTMHMHTVIILHSIGWITVTITSAWQ